ncbi:MAG: glycosyltransferase family 39 protein [Bacteroidetes bacterium]|nr:glycosyltransferase family 39 protein [Bacteroidota bacterium]HET6245299.1 glycosyltransferase family 39 protein [Bacteroidia bacterium]
MDKKDNYLFYSLIAIGIVLRFISPFEIPFTHDEFSALFRTYYDNFSDLIAKGVIETDVHPAGVQVFIHYYVMLFGRSELIVKLPFIFFGIGTLILVYIIGKKWFNPFTGLLAVAYCASIQYTIIFSQMARPYISGLFFALAMVYYWDKIVFKPEDKFFKHSALFVLFSAICAYNHHFSLLFAAIVGLTGLFFINKKFYVKYLISGAMIFVLYIPHLSIFFHQLNIGGVGNWLPKPTYNFFLEYVMYIFHFSYFALIPALFISLLSFINPLKEKFFRNKYWIIAVLWFLTPLTIGFLYSYYVNPVIQYSGLLFSFPFFFLVIFGNIKNYNFPIKFITLITIVGINIFTLVVNRNHYQVFYNSFFKDALVQNDKNYREFGNQEYTGIIESFEDITNHYLKTLNLDSTFTWYSNFPNKKAFLEFVRDSGKGNLSFSFLHGSAHTMVPGIMEYYPQVLERRDYDGGTSYFFAKNKLVNKSIRNDIIISNDFENTLNSGFGQALENLTDIVSYSGKQSFFMASEQEWGPTLEIALDSVIFGQYDCFDVSFRLYQNYIKQGLLVVQLKSEDTLIYWGASEVNEFPVTNNWSKVYHSIKFSDIDTKGLKNIKLSAFIWNKYQNEFFIDDFQVHIREGNPIIYGLHKKIKNELF